MPSDAWIDDLLVRTSRTFALAIPLLPMPTRRRVGLAYLLFRIADTIEDGERLTRDEKLAAFTQLASLLDRVLEGPNPQAFHSVRFAFPRPPCDNADYLELLAQVSRVLSAAAEMPNPARRIVVSSVRIGLDGMSRFVAAAEGSGKVALSSSEELTDYCYHVAGIVGEMLTALFVADLPRLQPIANRLRQLAREFGEGLQLVNILKDSHDDALEGRRFVPDDITREELFRRARHDLQSAREFVQLLDSQNTPLGLIQFSRLPLELAEQSLDRVEQAGPGSKLTRSEVLEILACVHSMSEPPVPPAIRATATRNP